MALWLLSGVITVKRQKKTLLKKNSSHSTHHCTGKRRPSEICTLVDFTGLLWFDWWTTSLTIILAICHAISSWALMERVIAHKIRVLINHASWTDSAVNFNTCYGEPRHVTQTAESFMNILTSCSLTSSELPWTHFFIA